MLKRLLTCLPLVFCDVAAAQTATERQNLEDAFRELNQASREAAQLQLKRSSLYLQEIDGLWGKGTEKAMLAALVMLNEYGTGLSIAGEDDARQFVQFILSGSGQELIFGEADECGDCGGVPHWLEPRLPFDARFSDWRSANYATKLATAANYFSALVTSDAQLMQMVQSGQLRLIAEQLVPCMDQVIEITLQTGQKPGSSLVYPDISHSCAFMLQ